MTSEFPFVKRRCLGGRHGGVVGITVASQREGLGLEPWPGHLGVEPAYSPCVCVGFLRVPPQLAVDL